MVLLASHWLWLGLRVLNNVCGWVGLFLTQLSLMQTHCKRGHSFEYNAYVTKLGKRLCRVCHRDCERNRIHRNPEAAQRNRERVKAWRQTNPDKAKQVRLNWLNKTRSIITKAKSVGCDNCGLTDIECLDFHHRDPATKSFNIGLSLGTYSIKKIVEEIAKCKVLCANCHRKLHAKETTCNT